MAHNPDLTKPLDGETERPYPGPASRRRMHGCPQRVTSPEELEVELARIHEEYLEIIAELKAKEGAEAKKA